MGYKYYFSLLRVSFEFRSWNINLYYIKPPVDLNARIIFLEYKKDSTAFRKSQDITIAL